MRTGVAAAADGELVTTTRAALELKVNTVLLRWVAHTHRIPAVVAGHQRMFTRADLRRVEAVLADQDPGGLFRTVAGRPRKDPGPGTPS